MREFEAFKKQIIVDKKKTNDDVEIRVCSGFNTILTIIVVMFLSNCFSSIEPLKYFSHVLFHYGQIHNHTWKSHSLQVHFII